jgi:hypothetical protein
MAEHRMPLPSTLGLRGALLRAREVSGSTVARSAIVCTVTGETKAMHKQKKSAFR